MYPVYPKSTVLSYHLACSSVSLDPILQAGDMNLFESHFQRAKAAGLGITLHIAEV